MSKFSKLFIFLYLFISFLVSQNNSSHSTLNRVKCEKQILPLVGFEPTTSCIRGKPKASRKRSNMLIFKYRYLETIFLYKSILGKFESHRDQNLFFKTNIKIQKLLKLINKFYFDKLDDIQ